MIFHAYTPWAPPFAPPVCSLLPSSAPLPHLRLFHVPCVDATICKFDAQLTLHEAFHRILFPNPHRPSHATQIIPPKSVHPTRPGVVWNIRDRRVWVFRPFTVAPMFPSRKCQGKCQIEWNQNRWRTECQKKCQAECQNICRKKVR